MNERDIIKSRMDALTVCFVTYFVLFVPFAIWLILSKNTFIIYILIVIAFFMVLSNILYMLLERYRKHFWFDFLNIVVCIPIYPFVFILARFIDLFTFIFRGRK